MPGCDRAEPMGAGSQRLVHGQGVLRVPRLVVVPAAVDRRGHRPPWVQRRDGGVTAQHDLHPVVVHPAQREAPVGLFGPVQLGDVPVVEQVSRLDACANAELGHLPAVLPLDHLGVLDGSGGLGLLERVQRLVHGRVTDRVDRRLESVLAGMGEQDPQGARREVRGPVATPDGVGLAAPGRVGVQRAVEDDLQRAHGDQRTAAGEGITGLQARGQELRERVDVGAHLDPEQLDSGSLPVGPRAE